MSLSLSQPANKILKHNLTTQLENAIRATNTPEAADKVLTHLSVRVLEPSHGTFNIIACI